MKKLLIGTTEKEKFDEYKKLLQDLQIELVNLTDLGIKEKSTQSGKNLEENAILLTKHYYVKSGVSSVVDCSTESESVIAVATPFGIMTSQAHDLPAALAKIRDIFNQIANP